MPDHQGNLQELELVDMSKNVAFMSCEKALKKPWQAMLSFHEGPATHIHTKQGKATYVSQPTTICKDRSFELDPLMTSQIRFWAAIIWLAKVT